MSGAVVGSPLFGQLVIGPAGSGKTTYCRVMADYLRQLGRHVIVANIDPANDVLPYAPDIDINKLITVKDVMESLNLGPNGALLYCMQFLDTNFDWLVMQINSAVQAIHDNANNDEISDDSDHLRPYILFDSPGQLELYTNHDSLKRVFNKLNSTKTSDSNNEENREKHNLDMRLVAVNMVDSHYANDAPKFISVVINCLNEMIHLEMPHINVLSKVDILEKYGKLQFGLDFYCEVLDLNYLVEQISADPFLEKFKKLTKCLASIIEDYSLVSFIPLNINNSKSVIRLLRSVDRANGYYLTDLNTTEQIEHFYKTCEAADFESAKYGELLESNVSNDES